jgi:hypothetical protein
MPSTAKLILDTFSEVYPMLRSYAHGEFWDLSQHDTVPGAVYVIGRKQYIDNRERVRDMAESGIVQVVMSNPHEGSATLIGQLTHLGLIDLAQQHKISIIGGGDMPPDWPCLQYDKFLPEILDYEENLQAQTQADQIYTKQHKPYKFLFLNGRQRRHRRDLIDKLRDILDSSLWTNLDAGPGLSHTLPPEYEVPRYQDTSNPVSDHRYVKFDLFKNEWGEIYLYPKPYIDTYFSLVTETVFEIPYSFRTEKIWKPIVMGHPWIAVANRGFYRDMHNLGFKTFAHVIDESFDNIDNNQDRLDRIAEIVRDLCQQDLAAFLKECYNVSKYNQQHHREMAVRVRQEFPQRFFQFINERS